MIGGKRPEGKILGNASNRRRDDNDSTRRSTTHKSPDEARCQLQVQAEKVRPHDLLVEQSQHSSDVQADVFKVKKSHAVFLLSAQNSSRGSAKASRLER